MAFWSGEKLKVQLDSLKLVEPFSPDLIDCAAYTLRIGPEIFVTSDRNKVNPRDGCAIALEEDESFKIPPGQFAFLLSEERVKVPAKAVAFISFKTSQKWLGLVNVSGFHVDPGWDGNLMFGVYNAGPATIHLRRGMPMFLIWYADLDQTTSLTYQADKEKGARRIPEKYINSMSGKVFSPQVLAGELQRLKIEFAVAKTLGIGLLLAVTGLGIREWVESGNPSAPASTTLAPVAVPPASTQAEPLRPSALNQQQGRAASPPAKQQPKNADPPVSKSN